MEVRIESLIPCGYENAISRKLLVERCVASGLIDENVRCKDRAMRALIGEARKKHVIVSRADGGYYSPLFKDKDDLKRYIKQEQSRAIKTFESIKTASRFLNTIEYLERNKENG